MRHRSAAGETHLPAQFDDLSLGEHGLFHLTIPHGGGDELVSIGRKNGTTMISLSSTR